MPLGTTVTSWREDEIVAIAPKGHPLADRREAVTLDELGVHPLVLREPGSGVRLMVERTFADYDAPMRVAPRNCGRGGREGGGARASASSPRCRSAKDSALQRLRIAPEPLTHRFSILLPHAATPSRVATRFLELCEEPGLLG